MNPPIYLRIDPSDVFDFTKFVVDQANGRPVDLRECGVSHIPYPIFHFKDQFIDEIVKNGFTTFLNIERIDEELTTPRTPKNNVLNILTSHLSSVGIDNELIVIDPYFFAPSATPNYPTTVVQVLSSFLGTMSDLRIVTASHGRAFSQATKTIVEDALHNVSPSLRIHHSQSNELHDRFWISNNRQKGILIGTSLNGLGKKYAIIDYLEDNDVVEIINEFSGRNLI